MGYIVLGPDGSFRRDHGYIGSDTENTDIVCPMRNVAVNPEPEAIHTGDTGMSVGISIQQIS